MSSENINFGKLNTQSAIQMAHKSEIDDAALIELFCDMHFMQ